MPTITTKDGTTIYYQDWGNGQPILFSHGWPLSGDAWEVQMLYFAQQGYRVIAHDRRGHGRSSQPWNGNNMDQYADDLAELIEKLDLKNLVMIGHSTGGGEVAHYIGRHGTSRVGPPDLHVSGRQSPHPGIRRLERHERRRRGIRRPHRRRADRIRGVAVGHVGERSDGRLRTGLDRASRYRGTAPRPHRPPGRSRGGAGHCQAATGRSTRAAR